VSGTSGGSPVLPVTAIRARPGTIDLAAPGADAWTIRVQLLHAWDAVRIRVSPTEPVVSVKVRALDALDPAADFHESFVIKHGGAEIVHESGSLADAGVVNGATLLVMQRDRHPTREG
jgi:hypothetical protein